MNFTSDTSFFSESARLLFQGRVAAGTKLTRVVTAIIRTPPGPPPPFTSSPTTTSHKVLLSWQVGQTTSAGSVSYLVRRQVVAHTVNPLLIMVTRYFFFTFDSGCFLSSATSSSTLLGPNSLLPQLLRHLQLPLLRLVHHHPGSFHLRWCSHSAAMAGVSSSS